MGSVKDMVLEAEATQAIKWDYVCETKDFECWLCGERPLFEEREIFFETGLCGHCSNIMDRDNK